MRSPVAQVNGRLHQLPPKEFRKCRVGEQTAHDVQNRPARTLVRSDLLRSVRRGKLQLDTDVLTVLTELGARESRAVVPSKGMGAFAGRNHGLLDENRIGVHRSGLVLHEHHLFPLGLLVNQLDGVLEPAQRFRSEGPKGVDGHELERT